MPLISKEILHALWLNSDETVLMSLNPYRERSTPQSPIKDILNMQILTTKRLFIFTYNYLKKELQIIDSFYFDRITDLAVTMQHYKQKKAPLFYIAATKRPILSIKTIDKTYEFPLMGVLFVKKNVNKLIECVRKANPDVRINVSYKRDDMGEAYTEMMFEGVPENKRKSLAILAILLGIGLFIALWRVTIYLRANIQ